MRKWTWLLPTWVWLWAFKTVHKNLLAVLVGKPSIPVSLQDIEYYEYLRIDENFILVKKPIGPLERERRQKTDADPGTLLQ